jgi:N-methylhydantoinase B
MSNPGEEITIDDKVMIEVTKHTLTYISEEMGIALKKSAYSPNIRERGDHSCAVLDALGRTIGQAEHIPVHIGSLPHGLKKTLEYLHEKSSDPRPGEMYFLNDPYIAGTHLNDVTTIRPVFYENHLLGYTANKAHHVDVGGLSPASIGIKATNLNEEGTVITPTKLVESDQINDEVANDFAKKTRMPKVVLGDLRAQVAANLLGDRRLKALVSRIGVGEFENACDKILDQTQRFTLAEYAKMPKGTFTGEDFLELEDTLLPIRVKVKLAGDGVTVDFAGTAPQVDAPLNAVFGVTISAVTFAIKTLMPSELSPNDGFSRTITINAPEGSIVNPVKPAPVAGGNLETSQRIVDTIYRALIEGLPEKIPAASHGSMNNLMMGGVDPQNGETWAFYETIGGGYGGRFGMDGVDGIQVNMTNTLNTPIEVIEHYYPVIFQSYTLRSGSGGEGEWRGGVGIERSFTALATIEVTLLGERSRVRPYGSKGGLPGQPSQYVVQKPNGESVVLRSKESITLKPSEMLIVRSAGGGGYGDPKKRNQTYVKQDFENEYISKEQLSNYSLTGSE